MMTPLYGIDQSLIASSNVKAKLKAIPKDSAEYKQRLVAHIKQAFDVKAFSRGEKPQEVTTSQLRLGQGKIKLDDHLSVFIFEILGMPENVMQLKFRISNMANNDSQNNILRLIDGAKNKKYLLNHKNNFSGVDKGFFFAP
ncbi:hypothetical protein [Alteromonas lipotrueae]|uniref:hypothetical protein n=1 Tax=Alteromonas lipotrueae TaxID=2803814 RepID=UPI001C473BE5|nr:hypothetical protein [Alteromonas lipotrueae]